MKNLKNSLFIILIAMSFSLVSCADQERYDDMSNPNNNQGGNNNPGSNGTVNVSVGFTWGQSGTIYSPPSNMPAYMAGGTQIGGEYYLHGNLDITSTPPVINAYCYDAYGQPAGQPTYYYEITVYYGNDIYAVFLPKNMYQLLKNTYIAANYNPDRVLLTIGLGQANSSCGGNIYKVTSIRSI